MHSLMPPIDTPDNTFHDGNPLTGELGTIVTAEHLNNVQDTIRDVQAELIAVLAAAGKAPDSSAGQVLAALQLLFAAKNDTLGALAGLVGEANKLPYFTGPGSAALTNITALARTILGRAAAADILTDLGLGDSATRSVGTTAGTVAAGDDSRIVNAVQPSNPALCTAWVNFNGISPATIKSSHNVSSITRLSTGKYQINFTNPMGNTNYAPVFSYGDGATNGGASPAVMMDTASTTGNPLKTTTSTTMLIRSNTNVYDSTEVNAIFFGGM